MVQVTGFVIHHSACSSINGKGYDFFVTKFGVVIPCAEPTGDDRVHICIEGDFSEKGTPQGTELLEQFFVASKLILRLCIAYSISLSDISPHSSSCPGDHFPWGQLVLSMSDGYH